MPSPEMDIFAIGAHNDRTLNIPLLRKMIDYATTEIPKITSIILPEEGTFWNQYEWFLASGEDDTVIITETGPVGLRNMQHCGTAGCLAGLTALHEAPVGTRLEWGGGMKLPNGNRTNVPDYAAKVLGLNAQRASELFTGTNTADRLRELSERYIKEEESR